ncbi:unnamed protein product, partial [Ascophyllum nodosum]
RLRPLAEHGKTMRPGGTRTLAGDRAPPLRWLRAGVPKKMFTHFYAFGLLTATAALVDILFHGGSVFTARIQEHSVCSRIAARDGRVKELGVESLVCLILLTAQLGRRLWECVAVTRWGTSRMTFAGYTVGIVFYQLLLLTVLVEAPPLGVLVQEAELFASGWVSSVKVGQAMIQAMKIRHAVALGAFFVGSARQHEAIKHLASLRTEVGDGSAKTSSYAIPTAGWFKHVSCPHYFAELLIYLSFLLLAGTSGRGLGQGYVVALLFVFANQAYVAGQAHAWYRTKFEDYPRDRKRLVPGIW